MMNETLKTIYARRSVRAYKPEQITDDELETVLKAGEYAPSANNQQSQLFVAIQKKEMAGMIFRSRGIQATINNPLLIVDNDGSVWTPIY